MKSIQLDNIEDYYICTNKLTKVYGTGTKKILAVDRIDFTMTSGVHGFLGPNGAGKTSTINMLIGAISITDGEAFLKGKKAGTKKAREFIGFLPQDPAFYEKLSGLEYLIFLACLNSIPKNIAKQKALNLLKFFDLVEEKDRKIKTYSMGMKQKIGLAAGLIHDPKLLILDEPISRGGILITKYLALTCFGFLINIASLSLITLIAPLKYPFEGVAEFFVINLLFSLIVQFFFQSIAFGFSCLFKKTRNALLLPLLIIIITFFVLMTFRPLFIYMYLGDSKVPIYVQFQLFHFDLGYQLFNAYIGVCNIISGGISENMMFFLYMFGLYTQEFDEYTWEVTFTRNDYYSPLGSFIFLLSIAIGLLLLGYFLFKKRDISR